MGNLIGQIIFAFLMAFALAPTLEAWQSYTFFAGLAGYVFFSYHFYRHRDRK